MSELDRSHPLVKGYRAWKKWEEILVSGRVPSNGTTGDAGSRSASDPSTTQLPEPASLAELQFWGEMKNAYEARFQDDLKRYLAAHPKMTREAIEQELQSLISAAT